MIRQFLFLEQFAHALKLTNFLGGVEEDSVGMDFQMRRGAGSDSENRFRPGRRHSRRVENAAQCALNLHYGPAQSGDGELHDLGSAE